MLELRRPNNLLVKPRVSQLAVVGETKICFNGYGSEFYFDGLVVEHVDVLGGVPFMKFNNIQLRPARNQITLRNGKEVVYGNQRKAHIDQNRPGAAVLRAAVSATVWSSEFIQLNAHEGFVKDDHFAFEPRIDMPVCVSVVESGACHTHAIVYCIGGKIRSTNSSNSPVHVGKGQHIRQVLGVGNVKEEYTEN